MRSGWSNVGIALLFLCFASVSLAAGQSPGRVGAYMMFRSTTTPENLDSAIAMAADAGVQFLIPIVKTTSGRAMYPSEIIPTALPGHPDLLKLTVESAHKRGMRVHAWFIANAEGGEEELSPTLKAHSDWCVVNQNGKSLGYLDPSSPEAVDYLCSLVSEVVRNYDVDGISLDYVRYPGGGRFCFCDRCVRLFKEATGYDAHQADKAEVGSDMWRKWRFWRMKQVNNEMAGIRKAVDSTKPGLQVSSYIWGFHTYGKGFQISQDPKTWIRRGYLDWINPSAYRYKMEDFRKCIRDNREMVPQGFPYLATIGVRTSHGRLNSVEEIKQQITEADRLGADGIILFTLEWTKPYMKELAPFLREYAAGP